MRTLVDANVVLRYMLCDDETMSGKAEQAIRDGAYLLPEVLAEVVYVLFGVGTSRSAGYGIGDIWNDKTRLRGLPSGGIQQPSARQCNLL